MNRTLFEIVEKIAVARYDGQWVMLCYGGAYEVLFGRVPGEGLDQRWAHHARELAASVLPCSDTETANDALRNAIRAEMLEQW